MPNNLHESFSRDFHALDGKFVFLELTAHEAWALLSQIQLAGKCPLNRGPAARIAAKVGREIQELVASTPALAEVAEAGWDSPIEE